MPTEMFLNTLLKSELKKNQILIFESYIIIFIFIQHLYKKEHFMYHYYKNITIMNITAALINRAFQSLVFNSGQKMALRAFYFIRALTKALTYYYINRSQRHLLVAIENNRFGSPINFGLPPDLANKEN